MLFVFYYRVCFSKYKQTAGNTLLGAKKKRWLYVGRITGNITEANLKEYLIDIRGQEIEVPEVEKLKSKGQNYSFSVGVQSEELYQTLVNLIYGQKGW
ncbi:hypothetical protein HHI36_018769 [Cryptolaemus montrouzieri]|uniref:Uncharacterized protein n=1 Tax=Cryptolaemus montrouzieri TaxID=559131 RepID=A0ABD2P235_9CUCU